MSKNGYYRYGNLFHEEMLKLCFNVEWGEEETRKKRVLLISYLSSSGTSCSRWIGTLVEYLCLEETRLVEHLDTDYFRDASCEVGR